MLNKVILMGRLTKDIELRHSQSGNAFCGFTLAVNNGYGDKKNTSFISCKAFAKTADTLAKYCGKGSQIVIEGRIQTGNYDKDGTKVYTTDVLVEAFYFADSKQSGQADTKSESDDSGFGIDDNELPF